MAENISMSVKKEMNYEILFIDRINSINEIIKNMDTSVSKILIVTDTNVSKLYLKDVEKALNKDYEVFSIKVKSGESSKSMENVNKIIKFSIDNKFNRNDLFIALGGGVIGDLTSFAASIYKRGIPVINIPTTLLSMVDSSIGGKTAVDIEGYKNMAGTFYMPSKVIINKNFLESLPEREFYAGFAEIMKIALVKDSKFYVWLIDNMYEICEKEPSTIEEMINKSILLKKFYVDKDPFDTGDRALLNLGHTIGHAIEKVMGNEYIHGECVALGCVAAAYISWKKDFISMDDYYEIRDMFVPFNLPISIVTDKVNEILETVYTDKKCENGKINFILLNRIGKAFICNDVSKELVLEAIESLNFKEEE